MQSVSLPNESTMATPLLGAYEESNVTRANELGTIFG
jgi:hypothetical protein